ncbi:MAG: helix-turn-helix domain-containing protein [Treponema sp.]|nr:helix-turn-helix domain-containing protein [Treponema sp.]
MAEEKPDWIDTFDGWPADVETVSAGEKCTPRTVQNWCADNGIRTIGRGNRYQFLIFRDDVLRFRTRPSAGRRWPKGEDKK